MSTRIAGRTGTALLAISLLAAAPSACSKSSSAPAKASAEAAAPAFDGWIVKTDAAVPREKIGEVEARLEGKIKSLRNVVYEVNGKKIQVNVIVPRDPMEADNIYRVLTNMKPAWATVRKGDVVYEFVGQNEAMDDIKKAHDKLAGP